MMWLITLTDYESKFGWHVSASPHFPVNDTMSKVPQLDFGECLYELQTEENAELFHFLKVAVTLLYIQYNSFLYSD